MLYTIYIIIGIIMVVWGLSISRSRLNLYHLYDKSTRESLTITPLTIDEIRKRYAISVKDDYGITSSQSFKLLRDNEILDYLDMVYNIEIKQI